jgi:hypothetical protein
VLLSRTDGFSFFIELIGEKQHVGSCHTNGGVPLKHPFSFHPHKERKSLTNLCSYKYHTMLHIVELFPTPNPTIESQFVASVT